MASILSECLIFCLQGRGERHGQLLAGEFWGLFQLPRTRPEISKIERPSWHGPCHASLHRESGPVIRVRLFSSDPHNSDSGRWLTCPSRIKGLQIVSHYCSTQVKTAGPRRTWLVSLPVYGTLLPCQFQQTSTLCMIPPSRPVECGSEYAVSSLHGQELERTARESVAGLS